MQQILTRTRIERALGNPVTADLQRVTRILPPLAGQLEVGILTGSDVNIFRRQQLGILFTQPQHSRQAPARSIVQR